MLFELAHDTRARASSVVGLFRGLGVSALQVPSRLFVHLNIHEVELGIGAALFLILFLRDFKGLLNDCHVKLGYRRVRPCKEVRLAHRGEGSSLESKEHHAASIHHFY